MSIDCMNLALKRMAEKAGYPKNFFTLHNTRSGFVCSAIIRSGLLTPASQANTELHVGIVGNFAPQSRNQKTYVRDGTRKIITANALSNPELGIIDRTRLTPQTFHGIAAPIRGEVKNKVLFSSICKALKRKISLAVNTPKEVDKVYYRVLDQYAYKHHLCNVHLHTKDRNKIAMKHICNRLRVDIDDEKLRKTMVDELLLLVDAETTVESLTKKRTKPTQWKTDQLAFLMEGASKYKRKGVNVEWRKLVPQLNKKFPAPGYTEFTTKQCTKKVENETKKMGGIKKEPREGKTEESESLSDGSGSEESEGSWEEHNGPDYDEESGEDGDGELESEDEF